LGAKQEFCSNICGAKQDFCSNICGAMQDFCSNFKSAKQDFFGANIDFHQIFWVQKTLSFIHFGCEARLLFKIF
jgi:hypothetical protein